MARRPRRPTQAYRVSEGPTPTESHADAAAPIDEETDSEDEIRPDTDAGNEDTVSSELTPLAAGLDVGAPARSAPAGGEIHVTNARDGLNLRSGPGNDFPVIGSLAFGTRVHLVKREGRWGLVDVQGDGATDGFVHLAFLDPLASVDTRAATLRAASLPADQVRAFWAARNPRGARLYDQHGNALVDPRLLHASAAGTTRLESLFPNYRIEIYGPNGGLRTSGSVANHGRQAGTGFGAAIDFVIIDRSTGNMLTNHPGQQHQHQGTVGENAPWYQSYYNEVVRAGSQLYQDFAEMARFGGYFASSNPMDTMHIDLRGQVAPMGGGSLMGGFTAEQMRRWHIPENRPFR
jgi:hypothetical protein